MTDKSEDTPSGEWRNNWPVVLAAFAGMATGSVHIYSLGAFVAPLEAEFGWSRSEITLGLTIASISGGLMSPFVGIIVDRVGSRRIGVPGVLLFLGMIALLSTATDQIWTWWALWFALSLGALCIKPTIWTAAVASRFVRQRGLALAATLSGPGLTSSLTPIVATTLIALVGWRLAYVGMAGLIAIIVFPLLFLFLKDSVDLKTATTTRHEQFHRAEKIGKAFLSFPFLCLATTAFSFAIAILAIGVNLLPILEWTGIARQEAAFVAGTLGIASIIGRLCTGLLLDRYDAHLIGACCVLFPISAAVGFLWFPGSIPIAVLTVFLTGLASGAEFDVIAYLTARHFGIARYGTIFGTLAGLLILSAAIGPTAANYIFDVTASYELVLLISVPMYVVASLSLAALGRFSRARNVADGRD